MSEEKVAVVTGSSRGLGLAVVRELCSRDVGTVYLTCRDPARGSAAVQELTKEGLHPACHQLDVSSETSVKEFADFIRNRHGGFDYLVNNAAIFDYDQVYPSYEVARRNIDVNYRSLLTVERCLFPLLREGARVVNISSACGHLSNLRNEAWQRMLAAPDLTQEQLDAWVDQYLASVKDGSFRKEDFADDGKHAEHRVSKIAVTALTFIQARKYAGRHISVNALHPGHLCTAMARGTGATPPVRPAVLAGRLLLDASSRLTGILMWCDGKLADWHDYEGALTVLWGDYYYYVHQDSMDQSILED